MQRKNENSPLPEPGHTLQQLFSGLRNFHGHTSVDHYLLGIQAANKRHYSRMKNPPDFACDMCAGDGHIIELVHQFDRLGRPVAAFNKFTPCHKCIGTGRDLEEVRKARRAAQ